MKKNAGLFMTLLLCVGTACVWTANVWGFWWVSMVVGAVVSLLPISGRRAAFVSLLIALCGWGLPLLWLSLSFDMHRAAAVIGTVMGFSLKLWWLVDVVTLFTGSLLCLAGSWLGRSVVLFIQSRGQSVVDRGTRQASV